MAKRIIATQGNDILRKKTKKVTEINDRIKETLNDMYETMLGENGVGIAAPQVGVLRQMFIARPSEEELYYMINPQIIETKGTQNSVEGCLSVPGLVGDVERPQYVKMKALDLDGNEKIYEFSDFAAIVVSHEYDHLLGILYVDKAKNLRNVEEEQG